MQQTWSFGSSSLGVEATSAHAPGEWSRRARGSSGVSYLFDFFVLYFCNSEAVREGLKSEPGRVVGKLYWGLRGGGSELDLVAIYTSNLEWQEYVTIDEFQCMNNRSDESYVKKNYSKILSVYMYFYAVYFFHSFKDFSSFSILHRHLLSYIFDIHITFGGKARTFQHFGIYTMFSGFRVQWFFKNVTFFP